MVKVIQSGLVKPVYYRRTMCTMQNAECGLRAALHPCLPHLHFGLKGEELLMIMQDTECGLRAALHTCLPHLYFGLTVSYGFIRFQILKPFARMQNAARGLGLGIQIQIAGRHTWHVGGPWPGPRLRGVREDDSMTKVCRTLSHFETPTFRTQFTQNAGGTY